ncbi:DUF1624 domain-containing protein [Stutzerimonas kirkiae]|uniref:DUF1624 domain-containing protein n=1 Tax=Stutzerimonas kirkiae TaxID=2211392 RepID=UPI002418B5E6|nr:heparan-alpha-glucosaminide N-acetyltransferase domain-containing protein [Stutzerimonas kirkiae]
MVTTKKISRIESIDILRGLAMLLMLVGHARMNFFLPIEVSDPMDIEKVSAALFLTRLTGHLCTFIFIFLAGASIFLLESRQNLSKQKISLFLIKRGLILIAFEFSIISFGWTFTYPPQGLYMQVIWATGLCMLSLAFIIYLPKPYILAIGLTLILGHNFFDNLTPYNSDLTTVLWSILHERKFIPLGENFYIFTAYPVLPWIGVICLGYCFASAINNIPPLQRSRFLLVTGMAVLLAFCLARALNRYGDEIYQLGPDTALNVMAFLNVTKYPPSLHYILLTAGCTLLLLYLSELCAPLKISKPLKNIGSAPMFFYISHLYLLKASVFLLDKIEAATGNAILPFSSMASIWIIALILAFILYFPTLWFSNFKKRNKSWPWLQYF